MIDHLKRRPQGHSKIDSSAEDIMTLRQDIHLLQILRGEAKIELPVKHGDECGYMKATITAADDSMTIYAQGGHTSAQAKYIAHLLNTAPALLAEIERLRHECKSYRNYIRSAPDHGVVDHE